MREAGVEKMSEYIENNASQLSLTDGDGSQRYKKEKRWNEPCGVRLKSEVLM